jgi:hypothetical protein
MDRATVIAYTVLGLICAGIVTATVVFQGPECLIAKCVILK